jgi:hypothetical protein
MFTRPLVLALAIALLPVAVFAADPTLSVSLKDRDENARKQGASIVATVTGLQLVDPGAPQAGQGHLHYRLDGGPVIATTATKLGFHALTPGPHRIEVALVGNDHKALGPKQTVSLEIPGAAGTRTPDPASRQPAPASPPPVGAQI